MTSHEEEVLRTGREWIRARAALVEEQRQELERADREQRNALRDMSASPSIRRLKQELQEGMMRSKSTPAPRRSIQRLKEQMHEAMDDHLAALQAWFAFSDD